MRIETSSAADKQIIKPGQNIEMDRLTKAKFCCRQMQGTVMMWSFCLTKEFWETAKVFCFLQWHLFCGCRVLYLLDLDQIGRISDRRKDWKNHHRINSFTYSHYFIVCFLFFPLFSHRKRLRKQDKWSWTWNGPQLTFLFFGTWIEFARRIKDAFIVYYTTSWQDEWAQPKKGL